MAGRGNLVEHGVGLVGMPAYDMQDLAENLALEPLCAVDLKGAGREEGAVLGSGRQRALIEHRSFAVRAARRRLVPRRR